MMRNGRDRRSENPRMCHASKERVLLFGTDQRITSGPAARAAAFKGRIHGCTRTIRGNVRFSSCTAGAVHTWHVATDSNALKFTVAIGVLRTWAHGWLRSGQARLDPTRTLAADLCRDVHQNAGLNASDQQVAVAPDPSTCNAGQITEVRERLIRFGWFEAKLDSSRHRYETFSQRRREPMLIDIDEPERDCRSG